MSEPCDVIRVVVGVVVRIYNESICDICIFKNTHICRHLKLKIASAIPTLNEEKW